MLDLIGQRLARQAGEFASLAGMGLTDAASGVVRGTGAGFGVIAKAAVGGGLGGSSSNTATTSGSAAGNGSSPAETLELSPELKPLGGETASSCTLA